MSTTGNSLATRNGTAPAAPAGALAIYADQVEWSSMQEAALNQLGLRNASDGDRMVFLHQAQRTGLDPFTKQIHMIERAGKWGIQTGIDGFRVMRDRAEKKAGVRGVLGQAVYIDAEGNEYKRWFKPMPPVGCEITYTVRELTAAGTVDTPYTSYLRFTEYAQYKADGKLTHKWSQSPAHMLEKCTEADVYRKAFPQDFSGIDLSDAPSAPDEDAPPAQPQRQRVDAAAARARNPQTVTAVAEPAAEDGMRRYRPSETDGTPEPSPAGTETNPRSVPSAVPGADVPAPAGEAVPSPATTGQVGYVNGLLEKLGMPGDENRDARVRVVSRLVKHQLTSTRQMTRDEAHDVREKLKGCATPEDLDLLLAEQEMADDPRDEDGAVPGE